MTGSLGQGEGRQPTEAAAAAHDEEGEDRAGGGQRGYERGQDARQPARRGAEAEGRIAHGRGEQLGSVHEHYGEAGRGAKLANQGQDDLDKGQVGG